MSNQNKKFNSWEEEYLEMLKQDGYFTFCKKCARALSYKRNVNKIRFLLFLSPYNIEETIRFKLSTCKDCSFRNYFLLFELAVVEFVISEIEFFRSI